MKKIICILICILLIIIVIPATGYVKEIDDGFTKSNEYYKKSGDIVFTTYTPGVYLIDTYWAEEGQHYNDKCPIYNSSGNHIRLGCWSVAIGQILNYHRLQSKGFVEYNCTRDDITPKHIVNDLDNHEYNWSMHVNSLTGASPDEIDNVSTFLFDIATVIQKDFGTGYYLTVETNPIKIDNLTDELIEHINYIQPNTEWDEDLIEDEIKTSIISNRPIMFFIRSIDNKNRGIINHAVVIDGYDYEWIGGVEKFMVHINFGWDDENPDLLENSWYAYDGIFPGKLGSTWSFNDTTFRKGLYIRYSPPPPELIGPHIGFPGVAYNYSALSPYKIHPPYYYKFDWGDGTFTDWLGRYEIGEPCIGSHVWKKIGIYKIKAKLRDVNGLESDWSKPLIVTMPRNRAIQNSMFQWFSEQFPILQRLLQRLGL